MNSNDYISSIILSNSIKLECIGKYDTNVNRLDVIGDWVHTLYLDSKKRNFDLLKNKKLTICISLSAELIKDKELLEILRNKGVRAVRIIDENYCLTESDYENLQDFEQIIVDQVNKSIRYPSGKILQQKNIFKKEYKSELKETSYFITRPLAHLEIAYLVFDIKSKYNNLYRVFSKQLISFRIYKPEIYLDLLEELKNFKIPSEVTIQLMGNPLVDDYDNLLSLKKILPNPIEIIYSTNQTILNMYNKKEFTRYNFFHAEIECGSVCSLDSYLNLLYELKTQEKYIKSSSYSPLEMLVYGYRYLHHNFYYDENYVSPNMEDDSYSRKFVGRRRKLSADGFTTLFSLLMRKCDIPVFRYSIDGHVRNIVQLKDSKYGINTISVIDPAWDAVYKDKNNSLMNINSYAYFMLSPKEILRLETPEVLSIPMIFSLNKEKIEELEFKSKCLFESILNTNYTACLYSFVLTHMFGYKPNNWDEFYQLIIELNEIKMFEQIDSLLIRKAIETVEKREVNVHCLSNKMNILFDRTKVLRQFDVSLLKRKSNLLDRSAVRCMDDSIQIVKPLDLNNSDKTKKLT